MNITQIVDEFLNHEKKKVLIIKGKWGAGKSYFWKNYVKNNRNKIREPTVAYASIFGESDIQQLQNKVFLGIQTPDNTEETLTFNKKLMNKCWQSINKKIQPLSKTAPIVNNHVDINEVIKLIQERTLHDFLICIDDIERKSPQLSMDTLLGFVSILKETKGCRLVLIMNEEQLSKYDKKGLKKYREKVVDLEITYEPKIKENIDIVFGDHEYINVFLHAFENMNVRNIRVMQFAQWHSEYFLQHLYNCEKTVINNIIMNIVTLCCFYYEHDTHVDITKIMNAYTSFDDKNEQEIHDKIRMLLNKYSFTIASYDEEVISYIITGKCNIDHFILEVNKFNEREKLYLFTKNFDTVLDSAKSNFTIFYSDVVINIQNFLDENARYLSIFELLQLIELAVRIKQIIITHKHLEDFIIENANTMNYYTIQSMRNFNLTENAIIKLDEREKQIQSEGIKNILSAIREIVETEAIGEDDSKFLMLQTVDDFYDWLKKESDMKLISTIQGFFMLFRNSSGADEMKQVCEKINIALAKIALEDPLNAYRVNIVTGE